MYVELIGYIASILVVISMLMTSIIRLRIINTAGCIVFAAYAMAIRSYPTAATNVVLTLVNVYNLHRILKKHQDYTVVKTNIEDVFVHYFLSVHEKEIKKLFPAINKALPYNHVYLVCHGTNVAELFLATTDSDGAVNIKADYISPAYKDSAVGTYLYTWLAEQKLTKFNTASCVPEHRAFLTKYGFTEQNGLWVRDKAGAS